MNPCVVFLARHGETDWNRAGRWQGHTDIPLNQTGRHQAGTLAERLRGVGVTRVHTSDLARARETGTIVADALGIDFAGVDADLRERHFGVFEGLTRDEVATRYPQIWADYQADRRIVPPGAEPHALVIQRMASAVHRVGAALARAAAETPDGALVVSHGGAIRVLLSHITQAPVPPLGNGALFRVTVADGRFVTVDTLGTPSDGQDG